uniref:Uncharacterized protein n=1 Tax=Romanomermis culicivorax TaxID=13658 RepID=A0A915JEW7_ROMCU
MSNNRTRLFLPASRQMSKASWPVSPTAAGALTPGQSALCIESTSNETKIDPKIDISAKNEARVIEDLSFQEAIEFFDATVKYYVAFWGYTDFTDICEKFKDFDTLEYHRPSNSGLTIDPILGKYCRKISGPNFEPIRPPFLSTPKSHA